MNKALENLIRVTGWGTIPAETFIKSCEPNEIALLEAGKVQEAMDVKADREISEANDEPTDIINDE